MSAEVFDVAGGDQPTGIVLRVIAHPGAGRTSVVGVHGDALQIRVGAPPVEGRANSALIELVAELLGVKDSAVSISSGESSRTKRLSVQGVDPGAARHLIDEALGRAGVKTGTRRGPAPVQRRV
jgi:uncharacterized protein